ncbi:MAG: glycosyltransferase family 2 protein [bacterium]
MIIAVIPAYNEEKTISKVVSDVWSHVDQIIVVDDGSRDKTSLLARQAGAIVLRHIINRDQGASLQTGDEYALKIGADIIVHFDADGQHRAGDIDNLVKPIIEGEVEVTLGSRFLEDKSNIPFTKRFFILKPAILLNRILTGLKLTDAHNGLRAFSRKAAEVIKITHDRKAHNTEIPAEINKKGLKWREIPVNIIYNEYGQGFSGGIEILRDLIVRKII